LIQPTTNSYIFVHDLSMPQLRLGRATKPGGFKKGLKKWVNGGVKLGKITNGDNTGFEQ
jgi:hypothetical protein